MAIAAGGLAQGDAAWLAAFAGRYLAEAIGAPTAMTRLTVARVAVKLFMVSPFRSCDCMSESMTPAYEACFHPSFVRATQAVSSP